MGAGRKTQTLMYGDRATSSSPAEASSSYSRPNFSVSARNMRKGSLCGVIFGCKHSTMKECLSKQLFGLPASHFSYVRNIEPGMPLFLFNYSDRRLHGIFEAASHGQMNINRHGWTVNGIERTQYPSQVRVIIRKQCQALPENQFSKIIESNYYTKRHFWFELDNAQTSALISLFEASPICASSAIPQTVSTSGNEDFWAPNCKEESGLWDQWDQFDMDLGPSGVSQPLEAQPNREAMDKGEERVYLRLKQISLDGERSSSPHLVCLEDSAGPSMTRENWEDGWSLDEPAAEKSIDISANSSDLQSVIAQVEELKTSSLEHKQRISYLEKKLAEADFQIHQLKDCLKQFEKDETGKRRH